MADEDENSPKNKNLKKYEIFSDEEKQSPDTSVKKFFPHEDYGEFVHEDCDEDYVIGYLFAHEDSNEDSGDLFPHEDLKKDVAEPDLDRNDKIVASVALGVGCLVWVEGHDEAWIDGKIIAVTVEDIKVLCTSGKTVVVKSSYVYPKDAEAPPCGMDDMTNLAYFHEPVVLQKLKSRYDINEDYGDYDSDDDDFGSEPLREVDPYYNPEEYADLWGFNTKSNTKYTKKCCFDGLRVKKVSNATALPNSSAVCTWLPELPFELQMEILALAKVGLDTKLVLSTRWYREFYPKVENQYFSACPKLSHILALGGAILGVMSEGETIGDCLSRFMIDELVEGDDWVDLKNTFRKLSSVAHERGLCHLKLTKDGLTEFLLEVEKALTKLLAKLLAKILEDGVRERSS